MNSFSFEDKDPRFTRLKPVLAPRLLSKGLFHIKAMPWVILNEIIIFFLVKAKILSMSQDSQSDSSESFDLIENFDLEPPPHMIVRAPEFAPCSTNWLSRPV